MKNEGIIERGIQITISVALFLGAFFWLFIDPVTPLQADDDGKGAARQKQ